MWSSTFIFISQETWAPCSERAAASFPANCSVPVIPTRLPARGPSVLYFISYAAVSPTTITAGVPSPASLTRLLIWAKGARMTRSPGSVPFSMTAAGVSGDFPLSISCCTIFGSCPSPIRNTKVPGKVPYTPKSGGRHSVPAWVCPVIT